jgi:hypothetical protein
VFGLALIRFGFKGYRSPAGLHGVPQLVSQRACDRCTKNESRNVLSCLETTTCGNAKRIPYPRCSCSLFLHCHPTCSGLCPTEQCRLKLSDIVSLSRSRSEFRMSDSTRIFLTKQSILLQEWWLRGMGVTKSDWPSLCRIWARGCSNDGIAPSYSLRSEKIHICRLHVISRDRLRSRA